MAESIKYKKPDTYHDADNVYDFGKNQPQAYINSKICIPSIKSSGTRKLIVNKYDQVVNDGTTFVIPKGYNFIEYKYSIDGGTVNVPISFITWLRKKSSAPGHELSYEFSQGFMTLNSPHDPNASYWRSGHLSGFYYFDEDTEVLAEFSIGNTTAVVPTNYEISYLNLSPIPVGN